MRIFRIAGSVHLTLASFILARQRKHFGIEQPKRRQQQLIGYLMEQVRALKLSAVFFLVRVHLTLIW